MRRGQRRKRRHWWSGCGRGCGPSPPRSPRRPAARASSLLRASRPWFLVRHLCSSGCISVCIVTHGDYAFFLRRKLCGLCVHCAEHGPTTSRRKMLCEAWGSSVACYYLCRRAVAARREAAGRGVRRVATAWRPAAAHQLGPGMMAVDLKLLLLPMWTSMPLLRDKAAAHQVDISSLSHRMNHKHTHSILRLC